jgi:hypothetical protein
MSGAASSSHPSRLASRPLRCRSRSASHRPTLQELSPRAPPAGSGESRKTERGPVELRFNKSLISLQRGPAMAGGAACRQRDAGLSATRQTVA